MAKLTRFWDFMNLQDFYYYHINLLKSSASVKSFNRVKQLKI